MRRNEEARLLSELADVADKLNDWESQFVESLSNQLDNGRTLSERQRDKLIEVYERRVLGY